MHYVIQIFIVLDPRTVRVYLVVKTWIPNQIITIKENMPTMHVPICPTFWIFEIPVRKPEN